VRLKILFAIIPILLLNFHWVDWNVVENIEDHSNGYRVFEQNLDLQEIVPLSKKLTHFYFKIPVRSFFRIELDGQTTEYFSFTDTVSDFNPIRINPDLTHLPPPIL
jgi:hypothetical protein